MCASPKTALFALSCIISVLVAIAPAKCQQSNSQSAQSEQPASKPPAESSSAATPKRVRVSTGVANAFLVHKVQPTYPEEARRAHIEGRVLLHAVISKEGQVADLQVISGPSELTAAAIEAVRQWRFKPYLLKGEPAEVDTQLIVDFQLR
jgi:periplasmic protein TonB